MTTYRILGRDTGVPSLNDAGLEGYAVGTIVNLTLAADVEAALIRAGLIEAVITTGSSTGTLAARPAATTVTSGFLYFASDDNGGTVYRSDGATWTKVAASVTQSGGAELGYAEITSAFQVIPATANQIYDVTGLTVTVTVGARPIIVVASVAQVWHATANSDFSVQIQEDGSVITADTVNSVSAALKGGPLKPMVRRAPSAGSHTYKVSIKSTAGGNLTFNAGAQFPAFIRVVEC